MTEDLITKLIDKVSEHPDILLEHINLIAFFVDKLAPTLPNEFIIPIPHGIYERLKSKGAQ